MSILRKLTEGITHRDVGKEGQALRNKWDKTGLLEGLREAAKDGMAVLLENQAKQLLKEASAMSQGDVEGFAAVAFPIVRRVFGGLVANQLVSVQPMSLPSGLIFFLDFQFTDTKRNAGAIAAESIYGRLKSQHIVLTTLIRHQHRQRTWLQFIWRHDRVLAYGRILVLVSVAAILTTQILEMR